MLTPNVRSAWSLSLTCSPRDEWAVYVDGYSKVNHVYALFLHIQILTLQAIAHITSHNFPTVFPDFFTDQLQLRRCSLNSNQYAPALPKDIPKINQNISVVNTSMLDVASILGLPKWRQVGFDDLEKLAQSVSAALCESDETEQYHKLSGFRSWLFWTDLRRTDDSVERALLTAHFYGLVLAVLPVLPARYLETLHQICVEKIQDTQNLIGEDMGDFSLGRLLELAGAYW